MEAIVGVEDSFNSIRTEWHVMKEKWFYGETVDPVFEGMVKDFCVFDHTMQDTFKSVEAFMKGVDQLAEGLQTLSESVAGGLAHVDDPLIKADTCKMREATNQITRADAPHSAIAKLRRDMDFNIMNPVRSHLINNRNLKAYMEKRRRRLTELNSAKKQYEDCVKKDAQGRRLLQAQSNLESAKLAFHEVDRHVFEWLYILEEYRGDILDSTLQTVKYLQYEFFATSAHAVSAVLPARMEFRPMVEMTPEQLEAQVNLELQEADEAGDDEAVTDFSTRLIDKMAKDNKNKPGDGLDSAADVVALPVDPLSLSSLLSQGFEEGPARRALRKHQNNTQAAMDWLCNGEEEEKTKAAEEGIRMPTTIKRIQKLKKMRREQQEKQRRQDDDADGGRSPRQAAARSERPAERPAAQPERPATPPVAPQAPPVDLLAFDGGGGGDQANKWEAAGRGAPDLLNLDGPETSSIEPPDFGADFARQNGTADLPPQMSFDISRCEKQPLAASVAAGTAMPRLVSPSSAAAPAMPSGIAELAAQAQVTPEQLLLAAQQLAAAQSQQAA